MKNPFRKAGPVPFALAAAALGYVLRSIQLRGGSRLPLIALSIVMLLLFALCAAALEQKKQFDEVMKPDRISVALIVVGAVGMAVGGVMSFASAAPMFTKIVALLSLIGSVCAALSALLRKNGGEKTMFFYVLTVLGFLLKLLWDFRGWEVDPQLSDYCYMLFAGICFLLAAYQTGAYCFGKGNRRLLAFFSLSGIAFGAVAAAGGSAQIMLYYGGGALYLLALALDSTKEQQTKNDGQ